MKVWTLNELFRLTRAELLDLQRCVRIEYAALPPDHADREIACGNLRSIGIALMRANPAPA